VYVRAGFVVPSWKMFIAKQSEYFSFLSCYLVLSRKIRVVKETRMQSLRLAPSASVPGTHILGWVDNPLQVTWQESYSGFSGLTRNLRPKPAKPAGLLSTRPELSFSASSPNKTISAKKTFTFRDPKYFIFLNTCAFSKSLIENSLIWSNGILCI